MLNHGAVQLHSSYPYLTRIVRESDYSPASQLFLQGEKKNNDR